MSDRYSDRLKLIKLGLLPREAVAKPKKGLKGVSDKKAEEKKQERVSRTGEDTEKEKWFQSVRLQMDGVCKCGCGLPSQKRNDAVFRSCICHIFPQRLFPSVKHHPLNWVERTFWGGHHTNMDNKSMDLWKNFADWDNIKARFMVLEKCLTEDEKKRKFYHHLRDLVYSG